MNAQLIGDLEKASTHVGIPSNRLLKWRSIPKLRQIMDEYVRRHGQEVYIGAGPSFELSNNPKFRARLASRDLARAEESILEAARSDDRTFFKELGKCLSRKSAKSDALCLNKREAYVAGLLAQFPFIRAHDANAELVRAGFPSISEDNFRNLKMRLNKRFHYWVLR